MEKKKSTAVGAGEKTSNGGGLLIGLLSALAVVALLEVVLVLYIGVTVSRNKDTSAGVQGSATVQSQPPAQQTQPVAQSAPAAAQTPVQEETPQPASEPAVQTTESDQQPAQTPEVDNGPNAGAIGNYHVEIKNAAITNDYEGNPAIIITYSWTNNSEETTSAMIAILDRAYQDGVQLEPAIIGSSDVYDADLRMKNVRPGTTIDVQCAYELPNATSIIEFELSEAFSLNNDMVSKNFDPAALS